LNNFSNYFPNLSNFNDLFQNPYNKFLNYPMGNNPMNNNQFSNYPEMFNNFNNFSNFNNLPFKSFYGQNYKNNNLWEIP